jgi:cysteine-rich repeat protein
MRALLAALLLLGARGDDPCIPLPPMSGPTAQDLPLCGNGLLDDGEVCDDGNRAGGDGCNAWCAAFDRPTKACTLAGQNSFYATQGRCMGASATFSASEAAFCRLNALAASPDGSYLVVADGGRLVRMDLFTDNVMHSLWILPATITHTFERFCSLFVLPDGDTLVAHECSEQNVVVFSGRGTQLRRPVSLPFRPSARSRAYFADNRTIIYAGLSPEDGCPLVYALNVSDWHGAVLARIGCVAYNVIESGAMYPSFSLDGMVPYQVRARGVGVRPCA